MKLIKIKRLYLLQEGEVPTGGMVTFVGSEAGSHQVRAQIGNPDAEGIFELHSPIMGEVTCEHVADVVCEFTTEDLDFEQFTIP